MGIGTSGAFDGNYRGEYVSGVVTVATTQVEAKVGASALEQREDLLIFNDGTDTIFFGPSGVATSGANKGIPVESGEFLRIPASGSVSIFLISDGSSDVIIQELG